MKIASDTDLTAAIAQPSPPSQAAPTPSTSFGAVLRGTISDAGAQAAPEELSGIGVMERAVDAEGAYVAGLFRMRYADGTYSGAGDVFEIDAMRRQALAGEAPGVTLSQEDYAADVEAQVLRNDDALSVVDIEGGGAERYGSDMVALNFRDGTRGITQKALYEAAASLGAFDAITTHREFAEWHLNDWAPGVSTDPAYEAAHTKFNLDQIAYNAAITRADPTIAARRLTAAATYAPDSEAARSAAEAEVEPSAVMAQPGTAQARQQAASLPEAGEISALTVATPVTYGVEADTRKISESLEVVEPALWELAASLQVSEQVLLNDFLDGEAESA
jgi:hypothetical protein